MSGPHLGSEIGRKAWLSVSDPELKKITPSKDSSGSSAKVQIFRDGGSLAGGHASLKALQAARSAVACAASAQLREAVLEEAPVNVLTLSVGVAQHEGDAVDTMREAQAMCNIAKRTGGNRVVAHRD